MPASDVIQHHLYWATQRVVPEKFRHSPIHGDVHSMAWLLLKGNVQVEYHGEEPVNYSGGQWIFHQAARGVQHFSEDAELLSIRFDILHPHGRPLFERPNLLGVASDQVPNLMDFAQQMVGILDVHRHGRDRYVPCQDIPALDYFRIESAFCAWIAEYISFMLAHGQPMTSGTINDPRVRDALDRLNRHDTRKKMLEPEIAEACGLGVNRLNALFRQEISQTMGEYYTQRRLRLARIALLDTSKQIKEIAFELGFSTPAHFSNWFNTRQECSPIEYRRQVPMQEAGR